MTIRIPFATDAVIRIHDDIIENAGGEFGVLNRGSIAFTIERVNGKVIRENIELCKCHINHFKGFRSRSSFHRRKQEDRLRIGRYSIKREWIQI